MKKLAACIALLGTFLVGCPDQIDRGRDMMRGASEQERKNVEGQAKGAGAID